MSVTMYDCYLTQFDCMGRILERRGEVAREFVEMYQRLAPDRLYLIGSGTSHNACAAAAAYMEEMLGIEVTSLVPSRVARLHGQRPMAVVVSQSGRSTNTVAVVERIKAMGVPVASLTDPKDTVVGRAADVAMALEADREPIGQRTRGYTATVLTLYLYALEAGLAAGALPPEAFEAHVGNLRAAAQAGTGWLEACQAFYVKHLENLKKARKYLFAGKGIAAKVADEDALKVLETLCYPATGYEYEEFLHGPVCGVSEELALFLFLSCDADQERMLTLARVAGTVTPNAYVISHDPAVQGDRVLYLPTPDPARLSPFCDILMGQLISARLTVELGRARHPVVMEIYGHMKTKFPQEPNP